MVISLKVIFFLMTASVSVLFVTGNKGGPVSVTCVNTPVTQTAHPGDSVTISCKYPAEEKQQENIVRHFCREDGNPNCTNLISTYTANYTKLDRFSLTDDKQRGVYTVTISTVTQDDTGRYRCAIERKKSVACLTEIHLFIFNITSVERTYDTGDTVKIHCNYPDNHENNEKFLCKGESPLNCEELIHTTQLNRDVVKVKFNIRDNKRLKYFYVTIKNVSTADSGTYWCASNRSWQDAEYIKILLTVAERSIKTKDRKPAPRQDRPHEDGANNEEENYKKDEYEYEDEEENYMKGGDKDNKGAHSSDQGIEIGSVVGCLAVILILVVVLLLFRHKLPWAKVCCTAGGSSEQRTNNTEENHGDPHYEEIHIQNQEASSGVVLPSVYATVNPPADQLHYASVDFQKDAHPKNGSSKTPAAEQTLYSTVMKPGE
ncbi:polymeric immunoglobulin receptor-like isoform X2 [Dicentrarchus labrax]|uniref:polymeric immunoglobulin receptor-like isoform X2 n=1 Tax=Dicentrarchus labrax TaxID=13489 RepID=UPI0021F62DF2|nr:polymeric immunoglobulin receptor-like isoform X2 [Dicentrarchus labrax]